MTYLELCQALRREASVSGTGPSTVSGQTSMYGNIVNWIKQAWIDIQIDQPNWLFMNKQFSFQTVASQRDYTAAGAGISDLRNWDTGSFLIYETALGETDQGELVFLPYSKWRSDYRVQMNARPDGRPQYFTLLPDNSVRFEPRCDKIYTIEGDYRRSTQTFAANDDVPTGFPEDLHMLIVWVALFKYAHDQNAPDALDKAELGHDPLYHRLITEQLPEFDFSSVHEGIA